MENKMPLLWKIKCRVLWNIVYHLHKYYRIKNLIPEGFDAQSICNETLMEYGYFFEVDEMAM